MKKKIEITFILPTINRKKYVLRAIDSCLSLNSYSEEIISKVLVYDGFSDDGAWESMQTKYHSNRNVTLKQVDRDLGFQETAFLALNDVETEYCTYMYNDDVISPYYNELINTMLKNQQNFIMGYGVNYDVNKIYNFKKPSFKKILKKDVILCYFGIFKTIDYNSLPVSPVPSISKTNILKNWVLEVKEFVKKSEFRKELMLKKNIGPDLIIYLYNLLLEKKLIILCNSSISQLSVHKNSMSIGYGKAPLSTGYWLSRIWYFEKYYEEDQLDKDYLSKLSSYIIVSGLFIFILNVFNFNLNYSISILYEIKNVFLKSLKSKFLLKTIAHIPNVILNRFRRQKKLSRPE